MADASELEGLSNEEHVSSPHRMAAITSMSQGQEGGTGDSCGPPPHKMRSPRSRTSTVACADNHSTDTKSSGVSGDSEGPLSAVSVSPKHKDPDRIKKDREREERVRQAREKLDEERRKKLTELQEQQRQAQENREKQLEMRRRKIEDLRKRDVERRAEVEKRRRDKENAERNRRETMLLKAEERVARYEAWKRSGHKGATMPTCKQLSVSTSVLYQKRNSDFSSSGTIIVSSKPDSLLALNTIPEGRRSVLAPSGALPSRPKSIMTLSASSAGSAASSTGGVKLREKSPRKPRPASVGTSMPSFVNLETPKSSSRSKSSDRLARERSRPRMSSSVHKSHENDEEKKSGDKAGAKISRRTLDRLSTPRHASGDGKDATSTPKRESPVTRISPRKAYSTSNLAMPRKKPSAREKIPKEATVKVTKEDAAPSPGITTEIVVATPSSSGAVSPSPPASHTPVRMLSPAPGAGPEDDGGSVVTPQSRPIPSIMDRSSGDITAEEYKARLAEKRRQAREKAEREAEEERLRQEELKRQEEERWQQEEEEQRRQDEEAMRLAEEARQAEELRLQKAIEAEDARRAEEAAKQQQDRIAREDAERRAKEEADRMELEKQEKSRKEEEERQERKKRLEMIMKRVKTESTPEGSKETPKSLTSSPTKSATSTASSDTSPVDPENRTLLTLSAINNGPENAEQGRAEQDRAVKVSAEQDRAVKDSAEQDKAVKVSAEQDKAVKVSAEQDRAVKDSAEQDRGKEGEESQSAVNGSLTPSFTPPPVTIFSQDTTPASHPLPESEQAETLQAVETGEASQETPSESPLVSATSTPRAGTPENGTDRPKFKSPLLQKLVEGKDDPGTSSSGGPRFKSPLLQNLLSKTKVGARMGLTQDHSMSTPDLSEGKRQDDGGGRLPLGDAISTSMIDMETAGSTFKETLNRNEEKDVDTSENSSSSSSPSYVSGKTVVANGEKETANIAESVDSSRSEPMDISATMEWSGAPSNIGLTTSFWSQQDSGASFGSDDLRPLESSSAMLLSLNGHGPSRTAQEQGLEDSSISMRSVGSITSSITDSATGSIFSSISSLPHGQGRSSGDRDFEELIDLSVNNKTTSSVSTIPAMTFLDNSTDLVNFNKLEPDEGSVESTTVPPPIIAFEESSPAGRQDFTDLLS